MVGKIPPNLTKIVTGKTGLMNQVEPRLIHHLTQTITFRANFSFSCSVWLNKWDKN